MDYKAEYKTAYKNLLTELFKIEVDNSILTKEQRRQLINNSILTKENKIFLKNLYKINLSKNKMKTYNNLVGPMVISSNKNNKSIAESINKAKVEGIINESTRQRLLGKLYKKQSKIKILNTNYGNGNRNSSSASSSSLSPKNLLSSITNITEAIDIIRDSNNPRNTLSKMTSLNFSDLSIEHKKAFNNTVNYYTKYQEKKKF